MDAINTRLWRWRWRWQSRRFRLRPHPPVVLLYHRINAGPCDPLLLEVSPENFAAHMRLVRKRGVPMGAGEFARRAASGTLPSRAVAVTFDDGYADNLHVARPIMRAWEIPGCVFVATGPVAESQEGWWDVVEYALLSARQAHGSLHLDDERGSWQAECAADDGQSLAGWNITLPDATSRHALYRRISDWLQGASVAARVRHVASLARWVDLPLQPRPARRFMDREELVAWCRDGFEIGGHTDAHSRLAALAPPEQRTEIATGRTRLAEWLGSAPTLFAYPFGTHADYEPGTRELVLAAGFTHAFANMTAPLGRAHPHEIPRVLVRNWTAEELAARIGLS